MWKKKKKKKKKKKLIDGCVIGLLTKWQFCILFDFWYCSEILNLWMENVEMIITKSKFGNHIASASTIFI